MSAHSFVCKQSVAKLGNKDIIPPLSFLKNRKKCPWKKSLDCVHLWIKFFIWNVVLMVSKPSFYLPNLVFKFTIMLIGFFWIIYTTIYLLFCLLIKISYFTDLEVYLVSLRFLLRPSKILIRLTVFLRFSASKRSYFYFSQKILTC